MKKILSSMVAIASMLVLGTSCSSEEVAPVTGESTVTLSVTLPDGIQSRAFGDGTTAQKLTMLVLDQDNKALSVFNGSAVLNTDIQLTKQVNLQLAAGKTYKVVCWAAAEGAPYSFNTTDFTVSANYTDATKTSDESLDAFYAVQDITVAGNTSETVKLYRPFAQLNIGTDDLAAAKAAGFEAETVTVTVPTYKSLDLLTGKVEDGDPVSQTFAANALPTGEKFPKAGYDYLSMNYILMSTDKQLVDVEFTVNAKDGATRTLPVAGVPMQRNYRTNIYGSLLTNSVNINVEIVPDFEEPDYDMDDAARIAAALGAGKSVMLDQDLTPGKTMVVDLKDGASVTLDLNGHTISNNADLWDESTGNWSLISVRGNGTLTIKGGTLKAKENDCFTLDVYDPTATLVIEDGNYVSNVSAVYVYGGNLKVKGGEFSLQQLSGGADPYRFTLNCYDSAYKDGTATIAVSGGKFQMFNPGDNLAEGKGTNFVAGGCKTVKTALNGKDAWMVISDEAMVVGGAEYPDFASVAAAINNGEAKAYDVVLTENVEWATGNAGGGSNKCFTKDGSTINLDLNGKTLTMTGQGGFRNGAKMNISNGTIVDQTAYGYESGETAWEFTYLEFEGGEYTFDNVVFNNSVMFCGTKTTATNCTFKGIATLASHQSSEYCLWINNGDVTIKNCKISNGYRGVKAHNGYKKEVVINITIDGCEFYDLAKKPGVCTDANVKSCVIKNSTFSNVQPGDQGKYYYEYNAKNTTAPTVINCTLK